MSSTQLLVQDLLNKLSHDVQLYGTLENKLKKQHAFLLNRNSTELIKLNQELNQTMVILQGNAINRCNTLSQLGLTANNDGMKKLLLALPPHIAKTSAHKWQSLFKLTLLCQELNNQNGRLLSQQKQSINKMINPSQQFYYTPSSINSSSLPNR